MTSIVQATDTFERIIQSPQIKVDRTDYLLESFGSIISSQSDCTHLLVDGPPYSFSRNNLDQEAIQQIKKICTRFNTFHKNADAFYQVALRLSQQLAYIYGFPNVWDKETLLLFLGIMLEVPSSGELLRLKYASNSYLSLNQEQIQTHLSTIMPQILTAFYRAYTLPMFTVKLPILKNVVRYYSARQRLQGIANILQKTLRLFASYSEEQLALDLHILDT